VLRRLNGKRSDEMKICCYHGDNTTPSHSPHLHPISINQSIFIKLYSLHDTRTSTIHTVTGYPSITVICLVLDFYRAMYYSAKVLNDRNAQNCTHVVRPSVRLSVRPSVTLMDQDRISSLLNRGRIMKLWVVSVSDFQRLPSCTAITSPRW